MLEVENSVPLYSKITRARLGAVDNYVDLDLDNGTLLKNQNNNKDMFNPNMYQQRRRTSTFPGALGGAFLATEKQSSPSIFSFREQTQIPENVCCSSSLMDDRTTAEDISDEHLLDTKCHSWGKPLHVNQCQCGQNEEDNFLPWKKRPNNPIYQSYSQKSSSKANILLAMALFILAVVTAFILAVKLSESLDTSGRMNEADMKTFIKTLSDSDKSINPEPQEQTTLLPQRRSTKTESIKPQRSKKDLNCCKYIKISSVGVVLQMYPSLLGTYENIKPPNESPVYKLKNRNRFLSRPKGFTESGAHTYTWGVNSKVGVTWGWIKGLDEKPCPTMIGQWGVFKGGESRWIWDETLQIECTTQFGE